MIKLSKKIHRNTINVKLPKRIRKAQKGYLHTAGDIAEITIPESIDLPALSVVVISC